MTCWGTSKRWIRGERSVIADLREFALPDVFRELNGYEAEEFSWYWRGRERQIGRRFDHVFASHRLRPIACNYAHEGRESGRSDHSAIVVEFAT